MLQGTFDSDYNLNAVVRHMWSMKSLTKVVAQVCKKISIVRYTVIAYKLHWILSLQTCLVTQCCNWSTTTLVPTTAST